MKPYRILITGSRNWPDHHSVAAAISGEIIEESNRRGIDPAVMADAVTIVHGHCPTGADAFADDFSESFLGKPAKRYPADWKKHGRGAGPIRNQQMVDAGADVVLAFPQAGSRGTLDCMKRAEAAGIKVIRIEE